MAKSGYFVKYRNPWYSPGTGREEYTNVGPFSMQSEAVSYAMRMGINEYEIAYKEERVVS